MSPRSSEFGQRVVTGAALDAETPEILDYRIIALEDEEIGPLDRGPMTRV